MSEHQHKRRRIKTIEEELSCIYPFFPFNWDEEDFYWSHLKAYVDQELFINPDLIENSYFQDFLYFHYCDGRTNDPNTHLYVIIDINRDYLDATWTEEKSEQAAASKKLAPYLPPVRNLEGRSYSFYQI